MHWEVAPLQNVCEPGEKTLEHTCRELSAKEAKLASVISTELTGKPGVRGTHTWEVEHRNSVLLTTQPCKQKPGHLIYITTLW